MSQFKPGDKVQCKEEHDIPAIFRKDRPTAGVVSEITGNTVLVNVPIGDDDPEEHSQCVFYRDFMLEHQA